MPNPIPFSVAAAQRNGNTSFLSTQITNPGGYTKIYWEFAIPNQAEYENAANQIVSQLLVNGSGSQSVWQGGARVNKAGNPDPAPAVEFDIAAVPAGATLQVQVDVNPGQAANRRMTVGIQNGVVS